MWNFNEVMQKTTFQQQNSFPDIGQYLPDPHYLSV